MHNWNTTIDYLSAIRNYNFQQDTIQNISDSLVIQKSDSTEKDTVQKKLNNVNAIQQIDFSAIDSIFKRNEEREKQIKEQKEQQVAIKKWYRREVDTTEILYKEFGIAGFPIKEKIKEDQFAQNFLYNISVVKPEEKPVKDVVFLEDTHQQQVESTKSDIRKEITPKYIPERLQFDWITILLIGSFLLLGWIRLFSKKYLGSLVKSVISYKESNTLYREKNSLVERASFMVNLLFLSNVSVFVIQIKHLWNIEIEAISDWIFYFVVLGSLLALYIFRGVSTTFIGYVFLKQRVFSEFFHNMNIFTKITGLFLFPIVVALQFLPYDSLSVMVYSGFSIIVVLYVLMIIRSFQIIIRKNVSIFYMILYLCAFEFAPFLIIYKILLSHS